MKLDLNAKPNASTCAATPAIALLKFFGVHNEKIIIKYGAKEIEYGGQHLNLQDPMPPNFY